ncbi:hypothetical protein [uncultured Ruminococcus sp.]|nr:hypothetical protein [uncultured Ruminococcus sp.]
MSIFRTLHLSDIHIGDTYKKNSADIAYRLITELEKEQNFIFLLEIMTI